MSEELTICRASISRHSKSFALASKLLPADCRDDAAVVYAWCRRADDAVDLAPPDEAGEALSRLHEELASVYRGEAQTDLVLVAFQEVVQRRGIPEQYPSELLAGMEMDVVGAEYQTFDDLLLYCYRVASTVGLMMCHVMGVRRHSALRNAAHLGIAMQLTNIARDVEEDWERNRIYLPRELLSFHGLAPLPDGLGGPFPEAAVDGCRPVLRELLATADRYYESGDRGIPALSPRCGLAVRAARLIYSAIGDEIRARGFNVLSGRAFVSTFRKLRLCCRALYETLKSRSLGSPPFERALLEQVTYEADVVSL